jgi:hypothetical protein
MSHTSTFCFPFVNLKFRFCDSPSFLSSDFSAAEHPSSRLVSPQWRGKWHFIDSQLDGEWGKQICFVGALVHREPVFFSAGSSGRYGL